MKYPILIPNIFNFPFTYKSKKKLKTGQYVKVPFGKSIKTGIVWHEFQKQSNKNYSLKKIKDVIETPALSNKTIKFFNLFSKYNLIPIGMSLKLHLLSGEVPISYSDKEYKKFKIKKKKNIFKFSSEQELAFKNLNI